MSYLPIAGGNHGAGSRSMVVAIFFSTCLLSIVSWYTTYQGMALYLSSWFAFLASLGVQSALVLVAWLIGFTKRRHGLLVAVYAITALVSIAFSYVSLYTWFSAKERPAIVQRQLYDTISESAGKTDQLLSSAIAEGKKHVLALEEMTAAEKTHGFISRAQDADPYLGKIRDAVAAEGKSLGAGYAEGSGTGVRYTAFERYGKLAKSSLDQMLSAQAALAAFRANLKPLDASDQQIRNYRSVYDSIPWSELEQQAHVARFERPAVPNLAEHLDRTASGQEDLLLGFTELVTAPTGRHIFALLLAAFIDVIVFLLAYASGPYLQGGREQRWSRAAAVVDGADSQVFVRTLLRKLEPSVAGMPRVDVASLTPGELQLCLLLAAKGAATLVEEEDKRFYLLDENIHEHLVESLSVPGMPLRATPRTA